MITASIFTKMTFILLDSDFFRKYELDVIFDAINRQKEKAKSMTLSRDLRFDGTNLNVDAYMICKAGLKRE